jgi:hypothetical protein
MEFDVLKDGVTLFPSIILNNEWGPLLWSTDVAAEDHAKPRKAGHYRASCWFPANFIGPGAMTANATMHSFQPHTIHFDERDAVSFQATETLDGARGGFLAHISGGIRPRLDWTVEKLDRKQ